jgi:GINS complex subunit 3
MVEVLSEAFKIRAAVIADQAHNPRGALGEGADFLRGLDENERQCKLKFFVNSISI